MGKAVCGCRGRQASSGMLKLSYGSLWAKDLVKKELGGYSRWYNPALPHPIVQIEDFAVAPVTPEPNSCPESGGHMEGSGALCSSLGARR